MPRPGPAIHRQSSRQITTCSANYLTAALVLRSFPAPPYFPGLLWGAAWQAAMRPIHNRIFFAHTDFSGISIFEEGFYQGIRAAKEMLAVI